ncbi:MAG TPA: phytanoyl-CoA dioxygenase [Chryseolinea sp.]
MEALSKDQIQQFIAEGFVKVEGAFSKDVASRARDILWRDTGCDPKDKSTWTRPVVRLGDYTHAPFVEAANTPRLHAAFDQLVGEGRWVPRGSLGSFPVRFPSDEDPGDAGWHVDASFPGEDESFFSWRINLHSKGRALLMLFLFSDVNERDAPTRIRTGSHHIVARMLEPEGEEGMSFMELAGRLNATEGCEQVLATGEAGAVYLCHPFLAHAAQPHNGTEPRFMAQPPLMPKTPFSIHNHQGAYAPVEEAIRQALYSQR